MKDVLDKTMQYGNTLKSRAEQSRAEQSRAEQLRYLHKWIIQTELLRVQIGYMIGIMHVQQYLLAEEAESNRK